MVLREYKIGVAGRIQVAEAVADEDRVVAGRLVEDDALALARAAHAACRVRVGKVDGHSARGEGRSRRVDREIAEPDAFERRPDEKPEAVADALDDGAPRAQLVDERAEGRIQVLP